MGKLHIEVVTPEKSVVSEDVDIVVVPGSLGEFGVLKGHVPFLTGVQPGELRYSSDSKTKYIAVTSGFAEVSNNNVSILVDAAEMAGEVDLKRAHDAMERAKEKLAKNRGSEDIDFVRAEMALKRAMVRIKVSEKAI
ncbi:MAG TPA: F0F1 ATP synthase subunit epsilon [Desulfobacteraceae bacterium]|nr:F0F1 ATP synthase subunit epsilon [Desulfobacteraceae bacterium]